MSCKRCSEVFENKFVKCFDEMYIAMYMRKDGVVRLQYKDVREVTNFNYCPYCGDRLGEEK